MAATASRCEATVASSPRATGPVSARSGPASLHCSTVRAHERREQGPCLARLEPGAAGHPLGGRFERDKEVRGDRRGRVVGGASVLGDLEGRHPEVVRERAREAERLRRVAGDGAAGPRERLGAAALGEGLERVQAEPAGCRGGLERRERGGAAGVADERGRPAHRRGGRRDLGVRHAEHDRVAPGRRLAAAGRALDRVPRALERRGKSRAKPAWPHDAQSRARSGVDCWDPSGGGPLPLPRVAAAPPRIPLAARKTPTAGGVVGRGRAYPCEAWTAAPRRSAAKSS